MVFVYASIATQVIKLKAWALDAKNGKENHTIKFYIFEHIVMLQPQVR